MVGGDESLVLGSDNDKGEGGLAFITVKSLWDCDNNDEDQECCDRSILDNKVGTPGLVNTEDFVRYNSEDIVNFDK